MKVTRLGAHFICVCCNPPHGDRCQIPLVIRHLTFIPQVMDDTLRVDKHLIPVDIIG